METITRIWEGKKECAYRPYFCGQVWNVEKEVWETVTADFQTEDAAENSLNEVCKEMAHND